MRTFLDLLLLINSLIYFAIWCCLPFAISIVTMQFLIQYPRLHTSFKSQKSGAVLCPLSVCLSIFFFFLFILFRIKYCCWDKIFYWLWFLVKKFYRFYFMLFLSMLFGCFDLFSQRFLNSEKVYLTSSSILCSCWGNS